VPGRCDERASELRNIGSMGGCDEAAEGTRKVLPASAGEVTGWPAHRDVSTRDGTREENYGKYGNSSSTSMEKCKNGRTWKAIFSVIHLHKN